MKTAMDVFLAYANAFEETYADDDWSRLTPYFADNATYEVTGGPLACKIEGPEAIFTGLKKSLDTLDRRCDERKIDVTGAPEIRSTDEGEELCIDWKATYVYKGLPPTGFAGRSVATVSNGVIVSMRDEYTEEAMNGFLQWVKDNNADLDGSYV